ncbi:MAG: gliding motility-associated C-terminal domain-containing protein [Saprospiraceae bacterium]
MKNLQKFCLLVTLTILIACPKSSWSQGGCDLDVNAGPDLFTCDPNEVLQLKGSIISNYTPDFEWSPTTGLDDPFSLTPNVILPPGIYKYKLKSHSMSNNLIVNGDFEAGPVGYTTDFNLVQPTGTLAKKEYGIGDNATSFQSTYRCMGNGNFFIGHASGTPGEVIWCQTVKTNPGEVFLFKFNYTKFDKMTASFYLNTYANGDLLGQTPYVLACTWPTFSVCFVAKSTSTTLCIREALGSTSGFGIDDIELFEKCQDEDEVEVEIVNLKVKLKVFPEPTCTSQEYTVDATVSKYPNSPNTKFIWGAKNGATIIQNYGSVIKGKGNGTYTCKITYDAKNGHCEDEGEVEINVDEKLEGMLDLAGKATCNKDTFLLTGVIISGKGPFEYIWSPKNNILSGQGTPYAKAINPDKYSLTIIDKSTGCEFVAAVKVDGDASLPKGLITGDTLINCSKPSATLISTPNDTATYEWTWITPDQKTHDNMQSIDVNMPGEVKLIVTDKKSKCQDIVFWNIKEDKNYPNIELGNNLILDCNKTEIDLMAKQEFQNGQFIYEWKLPGGVTQIDSGLFDKKISSSGKVLLKVSNLDNNCTVFDTIDVVDNRSTPELIIDKSELITCAIPNAKISTKIKAVNAKIDWFTKNGSIVSGLNTNSILVDQPGKYYIIVEDTIGHCLVSDSVQIFLDKQKPIVDLISDTIFRCKDTQKSIDGSNSSNYSNLKYIWTGNGTIISGQGTNTLKVGSAGMYSLTIIDTFNGCTDTKDVLINPDLNTPVVAIANPDILNCKVKTVQLSAMANSTSGNNLLYSWSSLQNNPIINKNTPVPTISIPGTYEVEVEDALNGCKTSASIKIDIDTAAPLIDLGTDLIWNCKTTDLLLDIKNNTQGFNFSYLWSTQNGIILSTTNQKTLVVGSAGNYQLTVLDNKNFCTSVKSIDIIEDKAIPIVQATSPDILTCIKTSALLDSKGSSIGNNLIYTWKDFNGQIISQQNTATAITKGKYILEIIDQSNNCSKTDTVEILENITKPSVTIGQIDLLTCKRKEIDLQGNILAPQNNYSVNWSTINGIIISGSNTLNSKVSKEGDYIITVTDLINGCITTEKVLVSRDNNVPVGIEYNVYQPNCVEDPGQLSILKITGGRPNYIYFVDGISVNNLAPIDINVGKHIVKVIDDNGCEITQEVEVIEPIPIVITLKPEVIIYVGDNFELVPKYSIPIDQIVSYNWSPAEYLDCSNCAYPKINGLKKDNTFTVNIVDKNGCTSTATIRIKVEDRGIWVPNVFSPNSDNVNDYFFPVVKEDSYNEIRYMKIFDRWGEMVWTNEHFQPNIPVNGWKGLFRDREIMPGVYVWVLEVEWKNGEIEKLFGDVTLLK